MLGVFDALHEAAAHRWRSWRSASAWTRSARRRCRHAVAARLRGARRRAAPQHADVSAAAAGALVARVDRDLRRRPGRPPLAGARPAAGGAARRAPLRDARGAPRRCRALGGLHPRPVRDLAARARRERRAGAGRGARAGWSTWRAVTAASRWRCATATRACGPPCSTFRRARRSGRQIVAEQGFADRVAFREGDVFELGPGRRTLDVVSVFNLVHHLPEERDRELCRMARAALRPGGCLVIGDSARPRARRAGLRARRDLEPALLRLEPQPQLHAFGDPRLAGGRRLRRRCRSHRNERSPWRIVVDRAGDPAHGRHRHGRLGAAAPAHRGRRAGALPRARPAPASATSACACRSRSATSPTRPRSGTRCAAWTRSCTWRPRSATSRARRSRS